MHRNMINTFGDYQTVVRVNGRAYIGIGHTPAESHRNAWDAVGDRAGLVGMAAVMRTGPISPERVSAGHRA